MNSCQAVKVNLAHFFSCRNILHKVLLLINNRFIARDQITVNISSCPAILDLWGLRHTFLVTCPTNLHFKQVTYEMEVKKHMHLGFCDM